MSAGPSARLEDIRRRAERVGRDLARADRRLAALASECGADKVAASAQARADSALRDETPGGGDQ